ncbi:MAG: hypothetical protein J6V96_02150 [Aeriscardovia sp.]|nr:hypothetical protein [Aeriscardovia sp.]
MKKTVILVPPLVAMAAVVLIFIFSRAPLTGKEMLAELCILSASALWIMIGRLLASFKSKEGDGEKALGTLNL